MEQIKIEVNSNKEDREAVALILIKNGYTVSIKSEKKVNCRSLYNYYIIATKNN